MYGSSDGREARKAAQSKVEDAFHEVESKKARAALEEALSALQGRSGLSTEEKVENLTKAREAVKVAAEHKKVVGSPVAETLQAARKDLKKAIKAYA